MESKKKRMTGVERRQAIIQAAMHVFSRNGFSGSTTRKIAERAGISEAMIYSHFRSKQDLYAAIIDEKLQEGEPLYYPLVAMKNKDEPQVFAAIVSNYFRRHSNDTSFLRLLLFSALEGHELAAMFVAGPVSKFFEFLAEYIQKRIDEGVFREVHPKLAARALLGMIHYFILLREILQDEALQSIKQTEAVETIVNIFCEGIMVKAIDKEDVHFNGENGK